MPRLFSLLLALFLAFPAYAQPQSKAAQPLPDAAYQEAVKKLSPEQQAKLKALEENEVKDTGELEVQIFSVPMEAQHCEETDEAFRKNNAANMKGFMAQRALLKKDLDAARDKHRKLRDAEAGFIDKAALERHVMFSANLRMALAQQLMQLARQTGGMKKTDCAKLAQKLADSIAKAEAAGLKIAAPAPASNNDNNNDTGPTPAQLQEMQQGAEKGEPDAMVNMGMMYLIGNGVGQDIARGEALLKKAAESGYDRGQYMLGLLYATGEIPGIAMDKAKAKQWLEKAAAQGNKKAENLLANLDKIQPPETTEDLKKKSDAGDADASYQLAGRYAHGLHGVAKDAGEALRLMQLAAKAGHPLAQSDLSVMLIQQGRGEEGVEWMERAAEAGVVNSMWQLSGVYMRGDIRPRDLDKAAAWAQKGADQGDARCKRALVDIEALKKGAKQP